MARGKYHEWLTDDGLLTIESWASDGLTNEDIAHNVGVVPETFSRWLKRYSQLSQALKKGREPVTRKLENALIKKAMGFDYEETKTFITVNPNGTKSQRVEKVKKYSAPDTSALIFLLKNYKPNKYRNYNDLTKRQIEAETKKLEAEARMAEQETLFEIDEVADDGFIEALESEGEDLWPEQEDDQE